MKTDQELTQILQSELSRRHYSAPEFYEWHKGEALYHGEPIQGCCTPAEQEAINATEQAANFAKWL